jgi:hypothetical protein
MKWDFINIFILLTVMAVVGALGWFAASAFSLYGSIAVLPLSMALGYLGGSLMVARSY